MFDAKGQMSGADDGICVCNLCLTAHVCVSILIYFCLPAWHMRLSACARGASFSPRVCVRVRACVFVCEQQMRRRGGQ